MPIDKFGRHLHQHRGGQSQVYMVEDATSLITTLKTDLMTDVKQYIETLKYHGIFYLVAIRTNSKGQYQLFNGNPRDWGYKYNLPPSTIQSVRCSPGDVKIHINGVEKSPLTLLRFPLNTGDNIQVTHDKKNSQIVLGVEFIVEYPLIPSIDSLNLQLKK
jgi:hypothetical protein